MCDSEEPHSGELFKLVVDEAAAEERIALEDDDTYRYTVSMSTDSSPLDLERTNLSSPEQATGDECAVLDVLDLDIMKCLGVGGVVGSGEGVFHAPNSDFFCFPARTCKVLQVRACLTPSQSW